MDNNEFLKLSEKEVLNLNGSTSESSYEAWRAGYNYARRFVNECLNTYNFDECISKLEDFSTKELEEFKPLEMI